MIKAAHLVKKFGSSTAVNSISFDVKEGENLILLGTSGCGKTTTLRMVNRLTEPDSGTIFLNGTDIRSQQPETLRRGIGYVLQNHGLFPHYTVAENIAIVPRLLKWESSKTGKRADELFEKLNLDPAIKDKYPAALSGGQQQRVGLARSLMVNPPVLLMDEPFGALDNLTRISIRKEFRVLDELVKKTIIMVTHDVQEAFEMGDRICLMDKGEIMQIGTPEDLLFRPANNFVANFLDEQRLQLELKSVLLEEILPGSAKNISVWDQMESLLQVNAYPDDAPGDALTIESLMAAFSKYKKR
ncbi:osmoprotectant transport system ATP-binding protein [Pedobacter westerhofensis]|uniref:Osmoprotectant transport system ATP-binding protein n=1 Tax=Pedobacter westerhofensis TaxID=425512 RepID=A0A521FAK9_9SPHI|nr:ATP-binding cassette domain-containing protein [Pedobacter westerhofensis]SMO93218.1 osmoprotectant transport system ATP-binding protein [Pedobacter westerhofensis]